MNVIEKLAREIRRVAELRHHYEEIGQAGALALTVIDAALENACKAMGSGDAVTMMSAGQDLEGIEA